MIYDDVYVRKVLPFLKDDYFHDLLDRKIFENIKTHVEKYNNNPSVETLSIVFSEANDLSEDQLDSINGILSDIKDNENTSTNSEWLVDETEKFCQDKAIYNAVMESIHILEPEGKQREARDRGLIPKILADALSISFDPNVGHDYLEDYEDRYEYYHRTEEKVAFDLINLNKITKGGLSKKSLNIVLAGTGVGKSLFMCHLASSYLLQGLNVLYITLEMAEERIAERIDANLLDVTMEDLHDMPQQLYEGKISKLREKTQGQLVIKEYPTASAHSGHFKSLMNELALKKSFRPDVIFIDYLNICASSRFKGGNISSYFYVKAIAEELRGLAVEFNVPIFSATQTTRTGYVSTDIGLEDTSESFGLPATADFMFALISNEELEALGQMKVKQLKNRYNDPSINRAFIIGVDRAKMRLYDVQQKAGDIVDANQVDEKEDAYNKFSDFKI